MNYDIFDETYYINQYSVVREAVESGSVKSGLDHFQQYGQKLGLTEVSRYFDEDYYLSNNPEVAAAVKAGVFASGLDHFIQDGYDNGRTLISPDYDETFYFKRHPELGIFVENRTFKSGLQHFIKYGIKEGRYATPFFEPEYLIKNPDIAAAVKAGIFKTGGDHYRQYGQFESTRSATFVGTSGSDLVTGFGLGKIELIGLQVALDAQGNRIYESTGDGEEDTFVGTKGSDSFILGNSIGNFYGINFGRTRALIKNFDPTADNIQLFGKRQNYFFSRSRNNSLQIFAFPGSTTNVSFGTIEGGALFSDVLLENQGRNNFVFSQDQPLVGNFLEVEYLEKNIDVARAVRDGTFASGLEHYTEVGQFEPNRVGTFAGTSGNDVITAFGRNTRITGVQVDALIGQTRFNPQSSSDGSNEFDTLIGGEGSDIFVLGMIDIVNPQGVTFDVKGLYGGGGSVRIRGFNQSQGDQLLLPTGPIGINGYQISPEGEDLIIGRNRSIILEGAANLTLRQLSPSPTLGASLILVG